MIKSIASLEFYEGMLYSKSACIQCDNAINPQLFFKDSKEDWPVEDNSENRASPCLPSGAAWYDPVFKMFFFFQGCHWQSSTVP